MIDLIAEFAFRQLTMPIQGPKEMISKNEAKNIICNNLDLFELSKHDMKKIQLVYIPIIARTIVDIQTEYNAKYNEHGILFTK